MKTGQKNNGSVFLMTVFVIALLAALTMGMLQMNTEEVQLMRNQIYAVQALCVAEAGLNDAFAEIRADDQWNDGFDNKSFAGGSYTVNVNDELPNLMIESEGTSSQGFVARMAADITVGTSGPPYVIRIDQLRINDEDDE
jgi:Tfp pilus assembly protein PilX